METNIRVTMVNQVAETKNTLYLHTALKMLFAVLSICI